MSNHMWANRRYHKTAQSNRIESENKNIPSLRIRILQEWGGILRCEVGATEMAAKTTSESSSLTMGTASWKPETVTCLSLSLLTRSVAVRFWLFCWRPPLVRLFGVWDRRSIFVVLVWVISTEPPNVLIFSDTHPNVSKIFTPHLIPLIWPLCLTELFEI